MKSEEHPWGRGITLGGSHIVGETMEMNRELIHGENHLFSGWANETKTPEVFLTQGFFSIFKTKRYSPRIHWPICILVFLQSVVNFFGEA